MKIVYIALVMVVLLSCNTNSRTKNSASLDSKVERGDSVALKFLNQYADFCDNRYNSKETHGVEEWVEKNQLLTDHFRKRFIAMLDSAERADPELGLDYDLIFDAQDYPDNGFEITDYNKQSGYVTLSGRDLTEFKVIVKVVRYNGKWLVDGSGVVNIPSQLQATR